jgi:hypothetical protein
MVWKTIDPQPVRAFRDEVELSADRWDDFTGAIGCSVPEQAAERITVLAGEYTPVDQDAFENACDSGIRI